MTRGVPAIQRVENGHVEWSGQGKVGFRRGLGCPARGAMLCWLSGSSLSSVASAHCDRTAVHPFFLGPEEATTSLCLQGILLYLYFPEWQCWPSEGHAVGGEGKNMVWIMGLSSGAGSPGWGMGMCKWAGTWPCPGLTAVPLCPLARRWWAGCIRLGSLHDRLSPLLWPALSSNWHNLPLEKCFPIELYK